MRPKIKLYRIVAFIILIMLLSMEGCTGQNHEDKIGEADVEDVSALGNENNYTFSITIKSPDLGCQQYADWWEVISIDGDLIYRRILLHSHVDEQPFTRSGGIVKIKQDQEVIIRSHMNNLGYGTRAMTGSVKNGFQPLVLEKGFAKSLETQEPLPDGCTH